MKKLIFILICVIILLFLNVNISAENASFYEILVDVEVSKLYLFKNGVLEKEYSCAGGKENTPSPIGTWKITSKALWGEGFGRKVYGNKLRLGPIWNSWYN